MTARACSHHHGGLPHLEASFCLFIPLPNAEVILVGQADINDAVESVLAVLRDAGRARKRSGATRPCWSGSPPSWLGAAFTPRTRVCIDFIEHQIGVEVGVVARVGHGQRCPSGSSAGGVDGGRAVRSGDRGVDRSVVPAKDNCPVRFRPLRDDYLASCASGTTPRRRWSPRTRWSAGSSATSSRWASTIRDARRGKPVGLLAAPAWTATQDRGLHEIVPGGLPGFLGQLGPDTVQPGGPAAAAPSRPPRVRAAPVECGRDPQGPRRHRPSVRRRQTRLRDDPFDTPRAADLGICASSSSATSTGGRRGSRSSSTRRVGRSAFRCSTTSAGRSSTTSGTAAPRRPARRCSSSTVTPSTRSGPASSVASRLSRHVARAGIEFAPGEVCGMHSLRRRPGRVVARLDCLGAVEGNAARSAQADDRFSRRRGAVVSALAGIVQILTPRQRQAKAGLCIDV